jgi:hypothetical protein
MKEVVK